MRLQLQRAHPMLGGELRVWPTIARARAPQGPRRHRARGARGGPKRRRTRAKARPRGGLDGSEPDVAGDAADAPADGALGIADVDESSSSESSGDAGGDEGDHLASGVDADEDRWATFFDAGEEAVFCI